MRVITFEELPSTNQYLQELIAKKECDEGVCIRARFQSSGRGQIGNSWESEPNQNLTFSFALYPEFLPATDQFLLSQLVSVAIKRVLDTYTSEISIKWPNDIYWKDKKIAGILIENSLMGNNIDVSVIGIGLNVNQTTFVSDAPNPVSLAMILERRVDLELLLSEILNEVLVIYINLVQGKKSELRKEYERNLYRADGFFVYSDEGGRFTGKITHVYDDGRLCIVTQNGDERFYYFKEVVFEH
ncbi:MAG: biotin--[acetyl-CoA-carboxylase] ligase [Bacteroidales bacterium]|nr:biotin--[acetyl-CoA-carboxylase] ligase [Bacteroidales bacterium]